MPRRAAFASRWSRRDDFAKGTSSRATKLVHGGVRYLAQGNLGLVREALRERATLLRNAPHLAQPLAFVMPLRATRWCDRWFYGVGLMLYDPLAGKARSRPHRAARRRSRPGAAPGLRRDGLAGGFTTGTASSTTRGSRWRSPAPRCRTARCVVNHCAVDRPAARRTGGRGRRGRGPRKPASIIVLARGCVVNATGVWVDAVRRMDLAGARRAPWSRRARACTSWSTATSCPATMRCWSPGPTTAACCSPCPGSARPILGTTDTPRDDLAAEPEPFDEEIEFILGEAARYLAQAPTRADVRSVWVGLRPLVKPPDEDAATPRGFRASTRCWSSAPGWSRSPAASGPPTARWPKTCSRAAPTPACCRLRKAACDRVTLPLVGAPARSAEHRCSRPAGPAPVRHRSGRSCKACPAPSASWRRGLSEAMVRFAARHEIRAHRRRRARAALAPAVPRRSARGVRCRDAWPACWRRSSAGASTLPPRCALQGARGALLPPA